MTRTDFDIIIAGGGIAGMVAAAAFGSAGFSVLCVDPATGAAGDDRRTTAIFLPGQAVLAEAGLWERLVPEAAALGIMRIVETGAEPLTRDFCAEDLDEPAFGWNIPNSALRRALMERIAELGPRVVLRPGVGLASVLARTGEARVAFTDGSRARARLLVAADGRDSAVRRALRIGAHRLDYGQSAVVCDVSHPLPHQNISIEIHASGGPFTLVPLPDRDERPASSLVWMERATEVTRLLALSPADFNAAMGERSGQILGPLTLISERAAYPIISQIASSATAERTALVAEALHVVPPIGAQGLNTSLGDIAALVDLARRDPIGLGGARMLAAYARRWPQVAARVMAVDALNRIAMAGSEPMRMLRAAGLKAIHAASPVRIALMRAGMGQS